MLNLRTAMDANVVLALKGFLAAEEVALVASTLSKPGFLDCNLALPMKLARTRHKAPMVLAHDVASALTGLPGVARIEAAAPGYVNLQLSDEFIARVLTDVLGGRPERLLFKDGTGERVQVEFVSANPTGPLHVGNGRGAALGSVLANLLETQGYRVDREYYVNDYGSKMRLFAQSIAHYLYPLFGLEYPMPAEGYRGAYIAELAHAIFKAGGSDLQAMAEHDRLDAVEQRGKTQVLASIEAALRDIGVTFDTWFSERYLVENGWNERVLEQFRARGVVYEMDGAVWLKSTDFGDDKDRVLIRRDGEPTYTLTDAAYHFNKYQRGYRKSIDILGADHVGHIVPMQALMKSLGFPDDFLEVLIYQIVHFLRGGTRIMLSKQSGDIIELAELVREVGRDQARVFFLLSSADSELEFDLDVAKENSLSNPAYYLKYTHARLCSVERQAGAVGLQMPVTAAASDVALLSSVDDRELIKCILKAQDEVDDSAMARQPHRVLYLAGELAKATNAVYQKEKVLSEDLPLAGARLRLMRSARLLLGAYAGLLGIDLPESMVPVDGQSIAGLRK